jgi:hypothetical protein
MEREREREREMGVLPKHLLPMSNNQRIYKFFFCVLVAVGAGSWYWLNILEI